jgi:hypothetical protein
MRGLANVNAVGYLGYYLPFGVASGILLTLSGGLLSTISPDTSTGKWIGYQIIGGTGRGIGLQVVRSSRSTRSSVHADTHPFQAHTRRSKLPPTV